MQMELLCIDWSGRGETPLGDARKSETLQAAQRDPHGKRTPVAEINSYLKECIFIN
jgi:hypothetical protein